MRHRSASLAFAFVLTACAAERMETGSSRCPQSEATNTPPKAPANAESAPKAAQPKPEASLSLKPLPGDATLEVRLVLGPRLAEPSHTFVVRAPDERAFRLQSARDSEGPIETQTKAKPGEITIELGRAAKGELHLLYTVSSRQTGAAMPFLRSDPDQLELRGDALLLPSATNDSPFLASIDVDITPYGTQESGASVSGVATSYGIGAKREVTTTFRELRNAVFVTGRMGTAVFDTYEGHDEAAWFGYTAFDPRPVSADNAAFRTAAGEFFGERSREPHTLLIVPDSRPKGTFVAARYSRSVIMHVAVSEPWSGPLRITTAAELLRPWMGERLWIGPLDPARSAEGLWFSAGVTRHLARDLLFRFGLIAPNEVAEEVNGLQAIIATSPHAQKSNQELASQINEKGVVSLLVARGALYALSVDQALRASPKKGRDLHTILRALYGQAKEQRGPLPTSAWIDALSSDLGKSAAESFIATIERGEKLNIPGDALGPCFKDEPRKYARYDLGFDEIASTKTEPNVIVGLRKGGPAEKAGLKEGDKLLDLKAIEGRPEIAVRVRVERKGEEVELSYMPIGAAAQGRGWVRRKDVPDESCTK